jgi:hypothetical protein
MKALSNDLRTFFFKLFFKENKTFRKQKQKKIQIL